VEFILKTLDPSLVSLAVNKRYSQQVFVRPILNARCSYTSYLGKKGNGGHSAMKWLPDTMPLTGITSVHKETYSIVNQLWKKQGTIVHAISLIHKRLVGFHIA